MKTTARSLQFLREKNLTSAWLVERRVPTASIDLWNFIDILVLDDFPGVLGIQACSSSDLQPHIKKIQANQFTPVFLKNNNRLEIHAWRKTKLFRGSKAVRWIPRIVDVILKDGVLVFNERA